MLVQYSHNRSRWGKDPVWKGVNPTVKKGINSVDSRDINPSDSKGISPQSKLGYQSEIPQGYQVGARWGYGKGMERSLAWWSLRACEGICAHCQGLQILACSVSRALALSPWFVEAHISSSYLSSSCCCIDCFCFLSQYLPLPFVLPCPF